MTHSAPGAQEACALPMHWHDSKHDVPNRRTAVPSSLRSLPPLPDMPLNGMGSAASALRYWERKQEIVANNLANASTDGFKAQRVFAQLLDGVTPTAGTTSDFSNGSLRETGSTLDVALDGPGFFVAKTADGE